MQADYRTIQTRMTRFGGAMLPLIGPLKEAGIPASSVDQLVRCATSVGANFAEARAAESRADFIHKLQVALKECREAKHWLEIIQAMPTTCQKTVQGLL